MNLLRVAEDYVGRNASPGVIFSSFIDFIGLVAHTCRSVTVPTGANSVMFGREDNFFVKYTSTAITSAVYKTDTVAVSSVCAGTGAELNPTARTLFGVSIFQMIAPAAASVTLSWYG